MSPTTAVDNAPASLMNRLTGCSPCSPSINVPAAFCLYFCPSHGELLAAQQQAMNRAPWFPGSPLAVGEQHHIDIGVGIVPNHRAHPRIDALFLCEQDLLAPIHRKLEPIAIHLRPLLPDLVPHLGGKERLHEWSRKQHACVQLAQKSVQVAGRDVRAAIWRAEGRERVDILPPGDDGTLRIALRIAPLGDCIIDHTIRKKSELSIPARAKICWRT